MGERSEDNRDAADSRLFTSGGAIAKAELKIVNLKPGTGDDARIQFDVITLASYEPVVFAKRWQNVSVQGKIEVAKRIASPSRQRWEEVGTWTTGAGGLDIKDIVWPGGSHVPPEGVPEKFHVKIRQVLLSSKCKLNRKFHNLAKNESPSF